MLTISIAMPMMAQDESTPPALEAEANDFLARVEEILGNVSQEDLVNAFKQAHREMRSEFFSAVMALRCAHAN